MKIGIVCYPTYGGSGVVATELGKALAEKGHQVHFISYSQPVRLDNFSENIFYHEVTLTNYPLFDYPPYELALASSLVDVVLYENIDILHVHYAIPHASAAYLAQRILESKGKKIPFITTLHGTDITLVGKDAALEPVITFAISQSNAITSVSESLKKDTYKHFGVRNPIEVIPNFICFDDYKKLLQNSKRKCNRAHYAAEDEKILIHISNFRKVKRVEDVLMVFNEVRKNIKTKLLLVGDGPERTHIERMIRELNMQDDARLLGKMTAPEQFLMISDLFILPSETESFGLAALEAMASGVPVISSNSGGLPEVNIHGQTGFMYPVGDINGMANGVKQLFENPELLSQFSQNALKQSERFDIHRILPLYEDLYLRVVNKSQNNGKVLSANA